MDRRILGFCSLLLVVGLFAMVRAQDSTRRSSVRSAQEPTSKSKYTGDHETPPSNSVLKRPQKSGGLADRLQSMRHTGQPPAKVEGLEVSSGEPATGPIRAGDADAGESSSSPPSVLKRKTKSAAERAAETQTEVMASRPGVDRNSSRRASPGVGSIPEIPPTDDHEAPPHEPNADAPAATDVLLTSAGPAIQVSTTGPRAILRGKPASFVVTLENHGSAAANDVHVRISLPTWVDVASADTTSGTARRQEDAGGTGKLVWIVNQLDPGTQLHLTLQLVAKDSRPVEMSVDWIFRPVAATAEIEVQQPQLEMSLAGAKESLYGESVTYVLVISNPGSGSAENVQVKLIAGQNPAEMINVGMLAAGQQKQVEVQLTANQVGAMTIRAEASADGELHAEVAEELLVRRADLQIAVTGPDSTFAGTESTYRVRVRNSGNAPADEVGVVVHLPAGAKLLASTEGGKISGNGIQWRVGSLSADAERVFELRCELMSAGENRVDARAQSNGGLSANQAFTTQVQSSVELNLAMSEPKGPRAVGEVVLYEIELTNRGTKVADDVRVVVQFSEGIEPVSADGAKSELVPGQVIFEPLGHVGAGEHVILKVKARADREGSHIVRTEIKCGDIQDSIQKTKKFFQPGQTTGASTDGSSGRTGSNGRR